MDFNLSDFLSRFQCTFSGKYNYGKGQGQWCNFRTRWRFHPTHKVIAGHCTLRRSFITFAYHFLERMMVQLNCIREKLIKLYTCNVFGTFQWKVFVVIPGAIENNLHVLYKHHNKIRGLLCISNVSVLHQMPIFSLSKESTKCRTVASHKP